MTPEQVLDAFLKEYGVWFPNGATIMRALDQAGLRIVPKVQVVDLSDDALAATIDLERYSGEL